jgi:hypothetical protein
VLLRSGHVAAGPGPAPGARPRGGTVPRRPRRDRSRTPSPRRRRRRPARGGAGPALLPPDRARRPAGSRRRARPPPSPPGRRAGRRSPAGPTPASPGRWPAARRRRSAGRARCRPWPTWSMIAATTRTADSTTADPTARTAPRRCRIDDSDVRMLLPTTAVLTADAPGSIVGLIGRAHRVAQGPSGSALTHDVTSGSDDGRPSKVECVRDDRTAGRGTKVRQRRGIDGSITGRA